MRIIAGRFGGRRLGTVPRAGVRPTADRVREALFSILGNLEGARVLDLFSGTGALGIEALSRGAASAKFVEKHRASLITLRANLDALELSPPEAEVVAGDALRFNSSLAFDLLLADPPYAQAESAFARLLERSDQLVTPGGRVALEHDRRTVVPTDRPADTRTYGETAITIIAM